MKSLMRTQKGQYILEYTAFMLALGIAIAFFTTYASNSLYKKVVQLENETKMMPEAGTCNPGVGNCD